MVILRITDQHLHRGTGIHNDEGRHIHVSTLPLPTDLPSDARVPFTRTWRTHQHGLPLQRHASPSLAPAGPTVSLSLYITLHTPM
jgi:hypothetical protein